MLSKQAFNALLKTLEEPPPHLKFILATTEVKKIPVTVLSRCQRFDLRRIKVDEMIGFLRKISDQESAKIDEKSLALIAKSSEGSVRDALSILDQVIITYNLNEETVTEDKVRSMLGLADQSKIIDLMKLIVEGNQKESLQSIEDIFDIGADPKLLMHSLLEICYLMNRTKVLGKIQNDLNISESDAEKIEELVSGIDITYLTMLWHFLLKGLEDLNLYPNLHMAFQMVLSRICHLKNMPDPQEILLHSNESYEDINYNSTKNKEYTSNEGKTQIKNISQEIEKPKKDLNEQVMTSNIKSFEDLVQLAENKKEIQIKYDLERNVRLVNFSEGKIDIAFNEKLSKDFIKNLTSKLLEWTGKRWIITLSKDTGSETIYEKKTQLKNKLFDEAKKSEVYKKMLEAFPDAELVEVRPKKEGEE